jgi:hypothetical protein
MSGFVALQASDGATPVDVAHPLPTQPAGNAAYSETAGTLSNSAVTIPANINRRGIIVSNNSDTVMICRFGATATATAGVPIAAGESIKLSGGEVPRDSISLFCTGAAKPYTIYEW